MPVSDTHRHQQLQYSSP